MTALASIPTPIHQIHHERFTTREHEFHIYRLWDLSMSLSGNIAVSGYKDNISLQTFIDLYLGFNSDPWKKLKLFYSQEFKKYSYKWFVRCVSFLEDECSYKGLCLVTCSFDKVEIIDTNNKGQVIRSCKVDGDDPTSIRCVASKGGEIFIGLVLSQTVIVFNKDLKETKKIVLKGMKDGEFPCDLQVTKDTLFISTNYNRALSIGLYVSSNITEYTDTTGKYSKAWNITASEILALVAVIWGNSHLGGDRINIYSLKDNKCLLVLDFDSNDCKIRISDRDRMVITGSWETGVINMYDLEQLFSFEAMKKTLAYIISPDECEKLRKYIGVAEEELSSRESGNKDDSSENKTVRRMGYLFTIIEERGQLHPYNINYLKDAVSALGDGMVVSSLKWPIEGNELYGMLRIKRNHQDMMVEAETVTAQKTKEGDRNSPKTELEAVKSNMKEYEKTPEDQDES